MSTSSTIKLNDGVMPLKYEQKKVLLLDQRLLPDGVEWVDATSLDDMCDAIANMTVRGAPSIGVAAAYGLAVEATRVATRCEGSEAFIDQLESARKKLQATRPTAVNLRWGTDEIFNFIGETLSGTCGDQSALIATAQAAVEFAGQILNDHIAANTTMGELGAALVPAEANIITHCNAGPLAACGWGTALGVIRSAVQQHKNVHVYVDETRPRNQGSKLTMWELAQDNIPSTLICDSMSGHLMSSRKIDLVVTGADRIARNGDTANKIGTYNLAVIANFHKVPFYIAAPMSTIDPYIESGSDIPIEERDHSEVTHVGGRLATVENARAFNPAFDVTPAELIAGIITERGILRPPYKESITKALGRL